MVQSLMCTYYMVHTRYDKWQHNLVDPRDTITFKQEEGIGFRKESAQGGSWFPVEGSSWGKGRHGRLGWSQGSWDREDVGTGSVSMGPSVFSGGKEFNSVHGQKGDRKGAGQGYMGSRHSPLPFLPVSTPNYHLPPYPSLLVDIFLIHFINNIIVITSSLLGCLLLLLFSV